MDRETCKQARGAQVVSAYTQFLLVVPNDWYTDPIALGIKRKKDVLLFVDIGRLPAISNRGSVNFDFPPYKPDFCLCQQAEEHCKVQFSIGILVTVVICNLTKLIVMTFFWWRQPTEPLVALGDAIASFLDTPDPSSRLKRVVESDKGQTVKTSKGWSDRGLGRNQMIRWFWAASRLRWILSTLS